MATPFQALLERMTQAICRGDAEAAAACFVEDGVYHDGFYGEFRGRPAIADMVSRHFHGNAADFSWTLSDVVAEGDRGYASYEFSYTAKMPGSEGRRAGFSGICRVRLKDSLIERYEEIFERAQVLARLGFADARILKSVRKWAGA
ncbi:MAG: nuclear transport factor 2 family protein [Burkholderiales bacterium]